MVFTGGKWRMMDAGAQCASSFMSSLASQHGMLLPIFRVALPIFVNLIQMSWNRWMWPEIHFHGDSNLIALTGLTITDA